MNRLTHRAIARSVALALLALTIHLPVHAGQTCDLIDGDPETEDAGGSAASGLDSIACGLDNNAVDNSVALGVGNQADNNAGTAIGRFNSVTAEHAVAIGFSNTVSTNIFGTAMGQLNSATGGESSAVGFDNVATGFGSSVFGHDSRADGVGSTAIGSSTVAVGDHSIAVGGWFDADFDAEVDANELTRAEGAASTAVGPGSQAIADKSVAVGGFNEALGLLSTVVGTDNTAAGTQSSAVGADNNAVGVLSNAFGYGNEAVGNASSAIGVENYAGGEGSVAVGYQNSAMGEFSAAFGANSVAQANNSVALGSNSLADRTNTVSVGAAGTERQITNVAAGTELTDAVNVQQLQATLATANAYTDTAVATGGTQANAYTDNREAAIRGDMEAGDAATLSAANAYTDSKFAAVDFSGINDRFDDIEHRLGRQDARIDRNGAMAAAMMNMGTNIAGSNGRRGKLAVGVGFQGQRQAVSIGYGKKVGERTSFSLSGAFSGGERSAGLGFGVEL